MCGIAVVLGRSGAPIERARLRRMSAAMAHRGPDGIGEWYAGNIGMAFRRLAILDLSPAGRQPMTTPDGAYTIVFNGEIYNYLELRSELVALGHRFTSSGDTEVLLRAYAQWGADCLPRLNGMWAFVIYDRRRKVLFGSRDRFGIKPLYLFRSADHVVLASEIKGIVASGGYVPATDWDAAARYLLRGKLDSGERTFWEGIERIPAGSAFEIAASGAIRMWQFWSLDNLSPEVVTDPAGEFQALFEDAVRLRMRSDVPVGVSLSGGLDSTSIACAMARVSGPPALRSAPLESFSFESADDNESDYIAETVAATGARRNRVEIDPRQLWNTLATVLWFHDEPVHSSSALIGFELMKLAASRGVKVLLSGQGADETAAGYQVYFHHYWQTLLEQGQFTTTWREINEYARVHRVRPAVLLRGTLQKLVGFHLGHLSGWRHVSRERQLHAVARTGWFQGDFLARHQESFTPDWRRGLDSELRRTLETGMIPVYLRVEDRNSMAHSVEARLPFLDYRLVSLLFRLPAEWKMRGAHTKYVVREAMRDRIPERVRTRLDKFGFPTGSRHWFSAWREPVCDLLSSRAARERGIYDVERILADFTRMSAVSEPLLRVVQFELWSLGLSQAATGPVPSDGAEVLG